MILPRDHLDKIRVRPEPALILPQLRDFPLRSVNARLQLGIRTLEPFAVPEIRNHEKPPADDDDCQQSVSQQPNGLLFDIFNYHV